MTYPLAFWHFTFDALKSVRLCLSDWRRERGGVKSKLIEYERGNTQTALGLRLSTRSEV